MRNYQLPSQGRLQELFAYQDGELIYKKCRGRQPAGSIAGTKHHTGYYQISVDKKIYLKHRLVYQYHYGDLEQEQQIDHIDRNKSNNRIENLRAVDQTQNNYNTRTRKNNELGVRGVSTKAKSGKYYSRITHKGKIEYLGIYDTIEEAQQAYVKRYNDLQ
jgi:hypothetical protein